MNKIHMLVFLVMYHIDIILDFLKHLLLYGHLIYYLDTQFIHGQIGNLIVVLEKLPSQFADEKPPEEEAGGDEK